MRLGGSLPLLLVNLLLGNLMKTFLLGPAFTFHHVLDRGPLGLVLDERRPGSASHNVLAAYQSYSLT